MNEVVQPLHPRGDVEITVVDRQGNVLRHEVRNMVLQKGREALASALANNTTGDFDMYINRMLFGSGGSNGGVPKVVQASLNGLFHQTYSKGVIAHVDPLAPTQVIFTAVLGFDEGNGVLNEMALQMANDDLYSMTTFADLNKTSSIQITFNWRLSFV